jgi:uncharacterized integral membrane protein
MSMTNEPEPSAGGVKETREGFRPTSRQIIAAIIVVVALIFILQNTREGHFSFLWFDFTAPVWLWIVIVFAGGVATGLLLARRQAQKKAAGRGSPV